MEGKKNEFVKVRLLYPQYVKCGICGKTLYGFAWMNIDKRMYACDKCKTKIEVK